MNKKEIFICQLAFGGYPVKPEDQKRTMEGALYLAKKRNLKREYTKTFGNMKLKNPKKKKHLSLISSKMMNENKNFNC